MRSSARFELEPVVLTSPSVFYSRERRNDLRLSFRRCGRLSTSTNAVSLGKPRGMSFPGSVKSRCMIVRAVSRTSFIGSMQSAVQRLDSTFTRSTLRQSLLGDPARDDAWEGEARWAPVYRWAVHYHRHLHLRRLSLLAPSSPTSSTCLRF